MLTMHFGVIDQPYSNAKYMKGVKPSQATTGQVAKWLEDDYHIMQLFWERFGSGGGADGNKIPQMLLDSMAKTIRTLAVSTKAPRDINPFAGALSGIETLFKHELDKVPSQFLKGPGIPTKRSVIGYSNRFKRRRGPPRPSFIDTGLYQTSFKAWMT